MLTYFYAVLGPSLQCKGSSVAAERIFSRAKIINQRRFAVEPARFERFVVTSANSRVISNRFPGFRTVDLEV